MSGPFALPDFRKLLASVATSHLGDQFALIATPWLVMQLGGDAMALGLVLALEGGPRALFMIMGGAFVDRYSPRLVLIVSDLIRVVLTAAMAVAVLMGVVELWMVFGFALGFGVIAGFAVPAGNAMVPMIVDRPQLEAGNATIMGASQIMGFIGPFIAGVLLGTFTQALTGVGSAFAIDAATFAVSALLIWSLRSHRLSPEDEDARPVWQAISQAFRFVWNGNAMRLTLLIIAAINFVFVGPMMVGVPVLAEQRLPEGAFAFGLLMSGFAGGNLAGYILAALAPQPSPRVFGNLLVLQLVGFAVVLVQLGLAVSTWFDFATLTLVGFGNGYITIVLISSLQARVPKPMMGRVMGLFLVAGYGLVPISGALAGIIGRSDITTLFVSAGVSCACVAIWTSRQHGLSEVIVSAAPKTKIQ